MPLKPFARPRQSMPASAGSSPAHDSAPSSVTFSPSSPAVPKSPSVRGARVSVGGALPGTPTPLHGKSSLSRTTTFEDQDQEHVGQDTRTDNGREGNSGDLANVRMAGTPLGKRLPRATIHGTPSYTNSAGTQTTTPPAQHTPTPLHTPVNPQLVSLSTPTTRSRSRLSFAAPGSPYYSPDSPSQISRSTIIPFDLDASRRAAQEQRSRGDGSSSSQQGSGNDSDGVVIRVQHGPQTPITKEKGRLASLIGMVSTPAKGTPVKRRGVVRKRSIWDRMSHLPADIADNYLPDTYALPTHTALPLALFLHGLHFLVRAPLFLEPASRKSRAALTRENAIVAGVRDGSSQRRWWTGRNEQPDWDDVFKTPEEMSKGNLGRFERLEGSSVVRRGVLSGFGSWVFFLLLVGLAAANAWYLFNSYRRYDLRYRTSPVDSPHAKTALKPEVGEEQEKPGTWKTKLWTATQYYLSPSVIWRFVNGQHLESRDSTTSGVAGRKRGDTMQVLNIWDPSDFAVVFFSYFSPLHVVVAQLFYQDHYLLVPLILAFITAHLTFLISQYQWLLKDRMTLNAEVMREYDQGFVYKKLFATRMDKSVQTNEAELLY